MPAILYDSHMHTPLCKHATGAPAEYAAHGTARGLKGVIFTCHNPVPGWDPSHRMSPEQFGDYIALISETQRTLHGVSDVRLGMESDYAPGMEPYLAELHGRADFDYLLGSVHPQADDYCSRFWKGDALAFQHTYFEHLALAAESGLFDCLSHPDLVKNHAPADWSLSRIWDVIERALDRIARTGAAMELNTSGLQKAIPEMNPAPEILQAMNARRIPVVLGSDAHHPQRVAADFEEGLRILQQAGYSTVSYFLERRRHDVPVAEALCSLQPAPLTGFCTSR